MAQAIKLRMPVDKELLSILKVDNHGWDIALFEDTTKMTTCLCQHCKSVCCNPVELGCNHHDDEIYLYCEQCLNQLITDNDGKCIIDSHDNPSIVTSRATRRQISKSCVVCPYSVVYKQRSMDAQNKNDEQLLMDIARNDNVNQDDDEKAQPVNHRQKQIQTGCQWRGKFEDLKDKHLKQCAIRSDPSFVCRLKVNKLDRAKNQILMVKDLLAKTGGDDDKKNDNQEYKASIQSQDNARLRRMIGNKDALIHRLQAQIKRESQDKISTERENQKLRQKLLKHHQGFAKHNNDDQKNDDEVQDHWLCGICGNDTNTFADQVCQVCGMTFYVEYGRKTKPATKAAKKANLNGRLGESRKKRKVKAQSGGLKKAGGAKRGRNYNNVQEKKWQCSRCGRDNSSVIEFCGRCGMSLVQLIKEKNEKSEPPTKVLIEMDLRRSKHEKPNDDDDDDMDIID